MKKFDNVNNPKHYTDSKYECIDVMTEVFGKEAVKNFCICNAFKYIWRHTKKNGVEDIKKAIWYLNRYVHLSDEVSVEKESADIKLLLEKMASTDTTDNTDNIYLSNLNGKKPYEKPIAVLVDQEPNLFDGN